MDISNFRVIDNELMKKDTYVFPKQALLIILNINSAVCMVNYGKNIKHTRRISRKKYFVINGKEYNLHKTMWCQGGLKLVDIVTKNVREDELNPRFGYIMVRIAN